MSIARRRLLVASFALALVGAAVAGAWLYWTRGSEAFGVLGRVRLGHAALLLAITALFVGVRFVRWQYLLRRVEVGVPTRESLRVYLASLAGTATPGYVGEAVRCAFLKRRCGSPLSRTLLCLVVERLLDVMTLGLIGALVPGPTVPRALMAGAVVVAWILIRAAVGVAERAESGRRSGAVSLARIAALGTLLTALAGSAVIWGPVTLGLYVAADGLGHGLDFLASIHVYTSSTLLGALSLMPAGFGVTGSAAILQLQDHGLVLASAVATVTLFRALTTGLCLSVGAVCLLVELRRGRAAGEAKAAEHFDELAPEYNAQFRPHVWNYLLQKRVRLMAGVLPPPAEAGIGLDLGCGLGLQGQAMTQLGFRLVGVDPAHNLLLHGKRQGLVTAVGDALALPFADGSFGFVYAVGVLHHLADKDAQAAACREIARVLKPGGTLVVQETNTNNPLFRFYMGYVFPILSRIDEGTEHWIEPARWPTVPGFEAARVQYFTFLPDFIPQGMMPPFLALERKLEQGRLQPYSVHYQAVLRKPARP
jgi:SAM-dependent methyltransferase/uncharacterized membrane protein YbhN (UPF0104 family)